MELEVDPRSCLTPAGWRAAGDLAGARDHPSHSAEGGLGESQPVSKEDGENQLGHLSMGQTKDGTSKRLTGKGGERWATARRGYGTVGKTWATGRRAGV